MLNLENKDYDLNTLFSFEVLKEILLKLARAQVNLEEKVKNIINLYENKEKEDKENELINFETDEKINNVKDLIDNKEDKQLLISPKQSEIIILKKDNTDSQFIEKKNAEIEEKNNNEDDNKNEIENIEKDNKNENDDNQKDNKNENDDNKKDSKKEIENKKEDNKKVFENKKEDNKKEIENKKEDNNKEIEENENKKENDSESNKSENENEKKDIKNEIEINEKDDSEKENNIEIDNTPKQISSKETYTNTFNNNNNNHNNGISSELIKNMSKIIKQNKERITLLEKEIIVLKKQLNETKKKKDDPEYIKNINKKMSDLSEKISELDEKIDNCEVKCTKYDVISMIQDNGNGTVDATKVIVKALEEKVFKKMEMVENKVKNNSYLNEKFDLIINKIENDRQNIEKLFNLTGENKESIDELKNGMKEKSIIIKTNEDNITKIGKKLSDAREKLNKKINELNEMITNNSNAIEGIKNRSNEHVFKLGLGDNQIDKEIIDDINLKINDLRKKVNDLDNSMKLHFDNNQIDNLSTKVQNMKIILDKKITKDDLKDLYNLHLSDLDEINDTNNRILSLNEQVKQINSNIKSIFKKIDNFNANLSLIQASQSNGSNASVTNQPIIDFSKYIDNQKLNDTIKPVVKEMEKMFQEVYSLRRELSDIQNLNKDLINQNQLDKFEEKVNEKITEVKTIFSKRYLDKVEHYKAVKNLESQIKSQVDDNKKDADSWLMAKRPLKCFNCASCESNIKNITPSNEYLAWNKYPAGDRIYRMGQGFSHMLQMMTTEFVKSIEKNANEIQNENEQNYNKNLNLNSISENGRINTHSYANSEKTLIGLSVNNKPQYFEEQQILRKKSGKVRLPLMSKYIKSGKKVRNSDIPVSDEEGENNDLFDKNRFFGSPKILKIMKKKNANILNVNDALSDNININTEINNNPEKP